MEKDGNRFDPTASDITVFVCHDYGARGIFLVGSFNDWDPTRTLMERQGDGSWQAELELAPGRYEYKFIVDGVWCCEPGSADAEGNDCVPNPFGTMNRVIEVRGSAKAKATTGA
jgi:1,4-alpha-glucan branching enzyme